MEAPTAKKNANYGNFYVPTADNPSSVLKASRMQQSKYLKLPMVGEGLLSGQ